MSEVIYLTFRDGMAYMKIPEGFEAGDLVVLEMKKPVVEPDILEALVRSYHQPLSERLCTCGRKTSKAQAQEDHVAYEVREALAGRATL